MLDVFALAIALDNLWSNWEFPGLFNNRTHIDTDNNKLVIEDQLCACGGWPLVNIR